METIRLGTLEVGRFILGSNPFAGFSHQGPRVDAEMAGYYTVDRIKRTLREAEELGVTAWIGRVDQHVVRLVREYRDEGGRIRWIAQTCPEIGSTPAPSIQRAKSAGADACYLHGGVMDHLLANGRLGEVAGHLRMIRDAGLPAGIAGHRPEVFEWAEREGADVDFYMCSYYDPIPRDREAAHVSGFREVYRESDRAAMVVRIATLSKPAIHYKILAAGRNDPAAAFAFAARHLRRGDAVCVGVFTRDAPDQLRSDVELFERALAARGPSGDGPRGPAAGQAA
jgi:hypothetical protein